MTDRKKPGVAFWATVVVIAVLVYVASFGPACWISSRATLAVPVVQIAYLPILYIWDVAPQPARNFLDWYSKIGADGNWTWTNKNLWIPVR